MIRAAILNMILGFMVVGCSTISLYYMYMLTGSMDYVPEMYAVVDNYNYRPVVKP